MNFRIPVEFISFELPTRPMQVLVQDEEGEILNIYDAPGGYRLDSHLLAMFPEYQIRKANQRQFNCVIVYDILEQDKLIARYMGIYV